MAMDPQPATLNLPLLLQSGTGEQLVHPFYVNELLLPRISSLNRPAVLSLLLAFSKPFLTYKEEVAAVSSPNRHKFLI